jgi:hypothetical protein
VATGQHVYCGGVEAKYLNSVYLPRGHCSKSFMGERLYDGTVYDLYLYHGDSASISLPVYAYHQAKTTRSEIAFLDTIFLLQLMASM